MKTILKKIILNFLEPFINYIIRRSRYDERQKKKDVKTSIIKSFQSVGYGFCLNGSIWNFISPRKIILGNNVHIGHNAYFHGGGGLIIGDNTHISRNVTIYTNNHDYNGKSLPYDNKSMFKPVSIGKNVWIGMNVSIVPGVTIGDGAIIGLGTVVNRNVESLEIVGSPKTINLKHRDLKHYKELVYKNKYGGINGVPLNEEEINSFLPTYSKNRLKPIVFILGTGRSGSTSIVKILNQYPNSKAIHEGIHQLIRLSTEMEYNKNNSKSRKLLNELNMIFESKIWEGNTNQLLIHSDQRLWNLIPIISDYFPNAKFIHLNRDPINAIKSMVLRKWYEKNEYPEIHTHDWAKYRLQGDLVKDFTEEEWESLNNIQKCTWYWVKINNRISTELSNLDQNRSIYIELENLNKSFEILQKFLNIKDFKFKNEIANKMKIKDKVDSSEEQLIIEVIQKELLKYDFLF